jgi:hypothetical protein
LASGLTVVIEQPCDRDRPSETERVETRGGGASADMGISFREEHKMIKFGSALCLAFEVGEAKVGRCPVSDT